ncbi:sensor histidine kinase [Rhodoplanes sp. Z2-YC6860]|uniref:sensor histidine kinase n=1 Tax=Rhodoplanes sp. Z2-YC6860 TaxID=674703 RepID=UPI00078BE3F4|nr:ATP-binding protein [Rhodoplanes sp. Z2-YC6860]AMN38811.1 PAS/PAC sensor signal transduction histidine kinase [Rhodoplanes sp. Z2-YC6860]
MPGTIRRTGGRPCSHPGQGGFRAATIALATAAGAAPARAEGGGLPDVAGTVHVLTSLNRSELVAMVLTLGVLVFGVVTAVMLVRTRIRASFNDSKLRDRIAAVRADHDRLRTLLMSDSQVLVSWAAADNEPEIIGDISLVTNASIPQRVLAFGSWLEPDKAQAMERATDALRAHGEGFAMQLMTTNGRAIEADGRAIGGRAVLRLREVSGPRRELTELQARHDKLLSDMESLRALIDALPSPVWTRDVAGTLTFVNTAYVRAVEARDPTDALNRALELLNRAAREEASRVRAAGHIYAGRQPAIVAGSRRNFDIIDLPTRRGSAGIGIDVTEAEQMRTELKRLGDAHRRTLDHISTGVAIFNAEQHLVFYNAAYRALWNLDPAFLDQYPTDSSLLDQLRATRRLPEEKDYKEWKAALHEAYRAAETREHLWHLPNRSTLRVVTTPNPEGGVTYLFDDVTESLQMARDYDALIRVQRETLDNLAEAVAVFGSDGRLRLHNPAFAAMWRLEPAALAEQPHIEAVIERCRPLYGDDALWQRLHAAVTAIEGRDSVKGRLELRNGNVADLVTVPLPDGATLVAFLDVTDTINVERALRERNEALETADALKVDFVHHVSYELRSPLTNIIGFAQLMAEPSLGALTPKQREYLHYIGTSTNALLAIINDILDLATIDAGAMKLNLGAVDIRRTMLAAAEGIGDRLVKNGITLDIVARPDIGSFTADDRRIRQILFNLLANAVGFSPAGSKITLSATRQPDAIEFSVADTGAGIPPEVQGRVFDWFQTHSRGSGHRGAGLGLSIVRSFVELHGGTVTLHSAVGEGTTVICRFPLEQHVERTAA